jgi:hypothetical protein
MPKNTLRSIISAVMLLLLILQLQGCALIVMTGAVAGTVAVTTVKVGAAAVGTAVDVTRAGVGVVTSVAK